MPAYFPRCGRIGLVVTVYSLALRLLGSYSTAGANTRPPVITALAWLLIVPGRPPAA